MKTYYFRCENVNTIENYVIQAKDLIEARHWIINHLDLSLNWSVKQCA